MELRWAPEDGGELSLSAWEEKTRLGGLLLGPGKLRRVAVEDGHRGQGVGRALMAEAEAGALRHGWPMLRLQSRDTAVEFYRRLGWAPTGPRYVAHDVEHQDMLKDASVIVRAATAADVEPIRALLYGDGVNEWNHLPEQTVGPHLKAIATGETRALAACRGETLIGFVSYLAKGFISEAAVRKEDGGRGIGTRLLRAAADDLFKSGCRAVTAERHEENKASAAMMRNAGFTVAKVYDDPARRPTGTRRTALCRLTPISVP